MYKKMRTKFFLFVHHTTSILAKLSTWCFEHSGDTSCSLLVNPIHTDESWEGRNTCMCIYIYIYILTRWAYFLYLIMKTMCMPGYHHNSFVETHALEHMICDYTWLLTMNHKCSPSKVRNIM